MNVRRSGYPQIATLALLGSLVCLSPAVAEDSPAQVAFERLKGLAGTWTENASAEHGEGAASTHVFRISANGSVVMETMFPDTEHEMINMYHLDGDTLRLTHYCAAGNQPQMKLAAGSTADDLTFEFVGGTNLDPAKDGFIHDARLVLSDDGTLESRWASWKDGKENHEMVFTLRRAGS